MKRSLEKLLAGFIAGNFFMLFFGALLLYFLEDKSGFAGNLKTAISAVTLTGSAFHGSLSSHSFSSQIVVLCLIQFAALNWLIFALQFTNIIGKGRIFSNKEQKLSITEIIKKAAIYLFLLEAFSAIVIYAFSNNLPDVTSGSGHLYFSIFHGISIFTGSGFTLLDGNFSNHFTQKAYIFQLVLAGILVLGYLGYAPFFDLTNIKRLRQRMLNPNINWTLQTRLAIYGCAIFISIACLFFYLSEGHYLLQNLKIVESGILVIFNSVGWFGGGFYSVSPAAFTNSLQFSILFFMLIGSASGAFSPLNFGTYYFSIKLITTPQNPYVPLVKNALSIIIFSLLSIFSASIICTFFYAEADFPSHFFHAVSAFTNTGLSSEFSGINSIQNPVYYILMLLGRFGIPVIAIFSFLKFNPNNNEFPKPEVMLV